MFFNRDSADFVIPSIENLEVRDPIKLNNCNAKLSILHHIKQIILLQLWNTPNIRILFTAKAFTNSLILAEAMTNVKANWMEAHSIDCRFLVIQLLISNGYSYLFYVL